MEESRAVKTEIARLAIKVGTRARVESDPATLQKLNIAVGLLNQAQLMADVDDSKATRLVSIIKGMVK